ncbi:MAG: ketohexokinase [Ectothiorhodospiraceae bacterium]|nr:ketohexokinase [Ectothiorhodospiraceae bacterium]
MARILTVGIATLDIINTVEAYPEEDTEVRACAQKRQRGGNASNTAVVLAQLGHDIAWAGCLADDASAEFILADLASSKVEVIGAHRVTGSCTPTSYVALNKQNGSRTIVHYRDLPEYSVEAFQAIDLSPFDWVHFEGRNIQHTRTMLDSLQRTHPGIQVSVEIEKRRTGIECLCEGAELLLYSRGYVKDGILGSAKEARKAQTRINEDPVEFLFAQHKKQPTAKHCCAWGENGAWGIGQDGEMFYSPALLVEPVIDTLGAGDTFNASMIHSGVTGLDLSASLQASCRLAGKKCRQQGLQGLLQGLQ